MRVALYARVSTCNGQSPEMQLAEFMADAHTRHFDVVFCWKVDRFGRLLKHFVNALTDLDAYGVAFVSLRDNVLPCRKQIPAIKRQMRLTQKVTWKRHELLKFPANVEAKSAEHIC